MFLLVILNVLDYDIESLHFSMIIATNTRDISMLCFATEIFLIFILVLQCKLAGILYGTFHIDYPGRLLQILKSVISKLKNR